MDKLVKKLMSNPENMCGQNNVLDTIICWTQLYFGHSSCFTFTISSVKYAFQIHKISEIGLIFQLNSKIIHGSSTTNKNYNFAKKNTLKLDVK